MGNIKSKAVAAVLTSISPVEDGRGVWVLGWAVREIAQKLPALEKLVVLQGWVKDALSTDEQYVKCPHRGMFRMLGTGVGKGRLVNLVVTQGPGTEVHLFVREGSRRGKHGHRLENEIQSKGCEWNLDVFRVSGTI